MGLRLRFRVRSHSLYLVRRVGTVHEGCQDDPTFPSAQFRKFLRNCENSMKDFGQALGWISIFLGCGERSGYRQSRDDLYCYGQSLFRHGYVHQEAQLHGSPGRCNQGHLEQ
ncbi:hypothetical protein LTR56_007145 [Elasticomyces elasticus]|nr:hypothetical protein LTR56_007145 [Elasticomyces elasticus]